ncbi:MAG TPA: methyltransferase domain-containing protein [Thermoguttaceae bacterium]|nr:methyltransferase domain-containing protein [Thermoguttaceae bacterium]
MYTFWRNVYDAVPSVLKIPVGWLPFPLIAGHAYRETMAREATLDRATRDEVRAFQAAALGRMLAFVCDQVPAYRSLRATVDRLAPLEAIKAFPFVDKDAIQRDLPKYLPRDFNRIRHHEITTGGTSGNQLTLYADDNWHSIELAFIHRQWKRVGYTTRCSKAMFRGVGFGKLPKGCYWQRNPIYHEWQYSPFQMNPTTLPAYVRHLQRCRPRFIHGYPSAVSMLAQFILAERIPPKSFGVRAALLGSEGVYPDQRSLIENAFDAKVYSWYGHSERLILGGECEKTTAYHMFPDYGYLEFIDKNLNVLEREGDVGELVGTTFWNRSLPLVRYRTDDFARRLGHRCECGRNHDRFDQTEGHRKQDCIVGKRGSRISVAALNLHGPAFNHVVRYQYYQNTPGVLEIRVITRPEFGDKDVRLLQEAYRRKVSDELDVIIRPVADIPLTPRGKCKAVISELDDPRPPAAYAQITPLPEGRIAVSSGPVEWHTQIAAEFDSKYAASESFKERFAIWAKLIDKYSRSDGSALDLGCGSGIFSLYLAERNRSVVAVDASAEMLRICEEKQKRSGLNNVAFSNRDINRLEPSWIEKVDLIICSSVLEYLDDLDRSLTLLASSLKRDGVLILSMPNRRSLYRRVESLAFRFTRRPRYYRYVRHLCTVDEIESRLDAVGLKIQENTYYGRSPLLSPLFRRLGLAPYSDNLFVVVARRA